MAKQKTEAQRRAEARARNEKVARKVGGKGIMKYANRKK